MSVLWHYRAMNLSWRKPVNNVRDRRWHVVAHHGSDAEPLETEHDREELGELHELIKRGLHEEFQGFSGHDRADRNPSARTTSTATI